MNSFTITNKNLSPITSGSCGLVSLLKSAAPTLVLGGVLALFMGTGKRVINPIFSKGSR